MGPDWQRRDIQATLIEVNELASIRSDRGTTIQAHETVTIDRVVELCERRATSLEDPGLCVACGAEASGVEPDARNYRCEVCRANWVYGAEELLIMLVP